MRRPKSEVTSCAICNSAIAQKHGRGRTRIFCIECLAARRSVGKTTKTCTCQTCGKQWRRTGAGRSPKHCSKSCRAKSEYANRKKSVACEKCSRLFLSKSGKARLCPSCHHYRPSNGCSVDCKVCGKAFCRTPSSRQVYCSRPCLWYAMRCGQLNSTEEWVDREAARTASVVRYFGVACKGCGCAVTRVLRYGLNGKRAGLRGAKSDTKSWCSRQCRFEYIKARAASKVACNLIARLIQTVLQGVPQCVVCGDAIPCGRTITCSERCSKERGRQQSRQRYEALTGVRLRPASGDRPCRLCDRRITPDVALGRGRSVCDYCNLNRGTFKSRAMMYGVQYEHVSRADVFRRDGWRCQLCGKKVLRKAKRNRQTRRLHPRTASLDHIVPMSKGGPHVESNVQCACLECNVKKHAKLIGQQRLF